MNEYEDKRSPEEIERDLAQTRAEVSSTIDAIQQKLTPGQLMDQAIDYWRSSAPADFGSNLSQSVRQNPLPVTLIGVGIAWLMMSGRREDSRDRMGRYSSADYDYDDYRYGGMEEGYLETGQDRPSTLQRAEATASDAAERVKSKAGELGERATEGMQHLRDRAAGIGERASAGYQGLRERAADMRARFSDSADTARSRASALQARSREQYYRARSGVSHMIDEQPLVLGAIGVAIGAALGASLPPSRTEDEWLGARRDDLMDEAKHKARAYVEPMKESAQQVAETARQEVRHATGSMSEDARRANEPASSDDVIGSELPTSGSHAGSGPQPGL